MKKVLVLFVCILSFISHANASGCDWGSSGLEEVGSLTFKTSGTLVCTDDNLCTFAMNSYDGKVTPIILTGPKKVISGQTWLKHLDGKFKKMREYGSCYDNGEIMIAEVIINGNVFSSSQLSYDSPVWP